MLHHVYTGSKQGLILYVGITTQKPIRRFQHHKSNGRNLDFVVVASLEEDLAKKLEFDLIAKHKPMLNKRGVTKPFSHITKEEKESRVGNSAWCQCCHRRRVNPGFTSCLWCSRKHLAED